jgi:hypothetical protein
MTDPDDATADSIEQQVANDAEAGVQSFSDGTNNVTAMDSEKRLAVADRLRRQKAARRGDFGMRTTKLNGGPGGF